MTPRQQIVDRLVELIERVDVAHPLRIAIDGGFNLASGPLSPEGYYLNSFDDDALLSQLLEPLGHGGDRRYRHAVFDHRTDQALSGHGQTYRARRRGRGE